MAKLPFMQFYPLDWIQDTIGLSPHARAAWIDIICFLWNHKTRGESTRTIHVWAQLVRMSPEAFSDVLLEFIDQDTCNVRIVGDGKIDADDSDRFNSDDKVTISSRRMVREENDRESHRLSQQRYQSKKHADTQMIKNDSGADSDLIQSDPEKLEVRSQKLEVREEKKEEEKKPARSRRHVTEDEFWASLKRNQAYSHIDFDSENGKMDAWLLNNPGREKTRKFVLNWLNKIPKPLAVGVVQIRPKPLTAYQQMMERAKAAAEAAHG